MPQNELHNPYLYGWQGKSDLAKVQRLLREHPEWFKEQSDVRPLRLRRPAPRTASARA